MMIELLAMLDPDINTALMPVLMGIILYYTRRDVARLESKLTAHEDNCKADRNRVWTAITSIKETLAELRGVVSTKPCKD